MCEREKTINTIKVHGLCPLNNHLLWTNTLSTAELEATWLVSGELQQDSGWRLTGFYWVCSVCVDSPSVKVRSTVCSLFMQILHPLKANLCECVCVCVLFSHFPRMWAKQPPWERRLPRNRYHTRVFSRCGALPGDVHPASKLPLLHLYTTWLEQRRPVSYRNLKCFVFVFYVEWF